MSYVVIKKFTDLQDNNHVYNVGDSFPHIGISVTEKRIAQLAGNKNRQGTPLIMPVKPPVSPVEEPKPIEGINYPKRGRKPKKSQIKGDEDDI